MQQSLITLYLHSLQDRNLVERRITLIFVYWILQRNSGPCHLHASPFRYHSPTQSGIRSAVIEVPRLKVVPPIRRKWNSLSTCSLHCKGRDENQELCTSTNGCGENVVILQEPFRILLADPELNEEADGEIHHDRRVDANWEVAEIPADDGGNEVVKPCLWEAAVEEVEWKGNNKAKWQGEDDPLICSTDAEEIFWQSAECNGLERLVRRQSVPRHQ